MIATGSPTINGNTATWSTRSKKQKAYFTTLLPAGAALINNGLPCPKCSVDQVADWEPYAQLEVNASGNPLSTQFLTVLEWSTPGLTQSPTTLVQSTAGQNFDGALIGSSLVMFLRNWPAILTSVTYPASGATTDYISDLRPNTTYAISGAGAPASATTDTAGVLTFVAAGTGNITIRTVAKTGATARLEIPALCTAIALVSSLVTSSRAERFRQ
jgi:hypothetical protein